MSSEEIRYLPYEEATRLVAAIQEEEDVEIENHRVFTVYSHQDKELCWFDFDEVMRDVGVKGHSPEDKEKVTDYIMRHLPEWVLDL